MKSVCVYLGANLGNSELFTQSVQKLGEEIAHRGLRLVYGGSGLGLMGILAQTVIKNGGEVIGIISKSLLDKEKPLTNLTKLIVTDTIQERKILMQQHSDGFIVFPGGMGTLEEAFETWNSIKIGDIDKPIGFLNLEGYYEGLFAFVKQCETKGFVTKCAREIPTLSSDPEVLLDALFEPLHEKESTFSM